jgi:hypothetical protein
MALIANTPRKPPLVAEESQRQRAAEDQLGDV